MNSGRIEYAPDYKSEKKLPTIKEMSGSINFGGRVVFEGDEQVVVSSDDLKARLEREVIDQARRYCALEMSTAPQEAKSDAYNALHDAVNALKRFESLQEKKG